MTYLFQISPLWPRRGEKKFRRNILCGKGPTTTLAPASQTQILDSSLLLSLFLRHDPASHSHLFPVREGPQTLLPWTFWGAVIQGNYQILPVKTWWIREKKQPTRNLKNQRSSPWPRLELSFQLNDNRFCLRNCYVIWCMGVIWLRTRDGSTSHKILPEFPDLCVPLLLIFVIWPIYLLQKHQVKGQPRES